MSPDDDPGARRSVRLWWRKLGFVGKFLLGCFAMGVFAAVVTQCSATLQARQLLAQPIRPVRFENAELGSALQQLANSTQPSLRLSMCPEVAARRVTVTTTTEMPLKEFVVLLGAKVGAEVDMDRHRHGGGRFPHLFLASAPCQTRSFVYAYGRGR
jgi:hypothetical protein